jgi:hypothetical protein
MAEPQNPKRAAKGELEMQIRKLIQAGEGVA